MKHNVGTWDRMVRVIMGAAMLAGAFMAPFPLAIRALLCGGVGVYLLMTALAGTCLGYSLMGKSTCPLQPKGEAS